MEADLQWNKSTTIWIKLDIHDPIQMHEAFQQLVSNLQKAFGKKDFKSLVSYIIEEKYEYVVIVPVIRGKMINPSVWPLSTLVTLYGSTTMEEVPFSFFMQPVSMDVLTTLGFEIWDIEGVARANKLLESFAKCWLHASQSHELAVLPESEAVNYYEDVAADYCKEISRQMSDSIQNFIDLKSILINCFSEMPESERENRPAFLNACRILVTIHDQILPFEDGQNRMSFGLEDLGEYARVLENNMGQIEAIRLLWITDILDHGGIGTHLD